MKKKCSKCQKELTLDHFYKKGERLESICKECKKKKRRTTYVAKRNIANNQHIIDLVDIIIDSELKALNQVENKIDKLLIKNKHKVNLLYKEIA